MTDVTKEMILDYLVKKGGVVKNVDLVRHFRKYLQVENPLLKDHAREVFKERVNSVASIKAEKGEKYLYLRPEYQAVAGRPPSGRTSVSRSERVSVSSVDADPRHSLQNRDSLTQLISDLLSPTPTSGSNFTDFGSISPAQNYSSYSSTGRGGGASTSDSSSSMFSSRNKNDVMLQSYKPLSSGSGSSYGSAPTSATPSSYQTGSSHSTSSTVSPSHYSLSTNPTTSSTTPPSASGSSLFSPTSKSTTAGVGDMGLGSLSGDLMSSFGDLFSSFGSTTAATTTGTGTVNGTGLGGVSSVSGIGSAPAPVTKSTTSHSMATSTALPQGSASSYTQSQRSPRRRPPGAPSNNSNPPPPSLNQTSPSRNSLQGTTTSSLQGSPRRPPPGPPPAGTNSSRASTASAGSGGGVASPSRRQSSGSAQGPSPSPSHSSLQGSPRRPPPGPPPPSSSLSSGGGPPHSTPTNSIANNSRRIPPPVPSPKTSTLSSRKLNYDPQSSPGRTASSQYANYGSPYHQEQRHSSVTPPTRVMSPPRVSSASQSTNKITSTPLKGSVVESPHANSSVGSSSIGGVGSLDLGDFTNTFSSFSGGGMSSFLDQSSKSGAPKTTPSPPSSSYSGGPPTSSNFSGPSASEYAPLSTAYPKSSGPSTNSNSIGPPASNHPISSEYSLLGSPSSQYSLLGPSGIASSQQPPPRSMQLGPSISVPSMRGVGGGGVADGSGRRQRSFDRTSRHHHGSTDALREQTPPTIRVHASPPPDSPGRDSRSRSPPYSSHGQSYDSLERRLRSQTNDSVTSSLVSSLGVQLRNKDGKQRSSQGPSARRSRSMEKSSNLENATRMSISMTTTPPTSRRNKPEVAPKPSPKPTHRGGHSAMTRSREDLRMVDGDDGSLTEMSEQDSWEIDPLEKDWMLASAQADLQGLQQLLMEEPNLVNRKDFIHGYTALHWAAKQGRCDIIAGLMLSGAQVDIKSNGGLTPLHLAAQSGYDNAIEQLISDFGADPNVRDYGGRRPIDIISNKANERAKSLLCQINNHGLPTRVLTSNHLFTFSQPHTKSSGLNRNWSSLGDMVDKRIIREKHHKKLPRMASIRKSFSIHKRKEYSPSKKDKNKWSSGSVRPLSVASSYSYNV